jgi:hypothetical protein
MLDMSLDTEKRLASQHTMKVPRQIELLDMSETTLQKVPILRAFIVIIHHFRILGLNRFLYPFVCQDCDEIGSQSAMNQKTSCFCIEFASAFIFECEMIVIDILQLV